MIYWQSNLAAFGTMGGVGVPNVTAIVPKP